MKNTYFLLATITCIMFSCKNEGKTKTESLVSSETQTSGQSNVVDDVSQKDIVKVAIGSADHTTLVAAIQAAELVNALSNAGPFTVFAPINAAFEKLPAGTVDELLKPENKSALQDVLYHHVTTSALDISYFEDGQTLGMVDGKNATMHLKDGAVFIDDAKIIGSVRASNGWVHVVDAVVLGK